MKNASETNDYSNLDHFVPHPSNDILVPIADRKSGENKKTEAWDQDSSDCEKLATKYEQATDAVVKEEVAAKLGQYLTEWEAAYKPSNDAVKNSYLPLDQKIFVKMFNAATVTWKGLTTEEQQSAIELADRTARLDQNWWLPLENLTEGLQNNRYCHSLNLRASAAAVLELGGIAKGTKLAFDTDRDLSEYLATSVDDTGATIDFRERQSLHYQVFGLQPLFEAAETLEQLGFPRTTEDRQHLADAVRFLESYIKGDQVNIEFKGTLNPRDIARNKDTALKPYQIQNQPNNELKHLLEISARILPNEAWIPNSLAVVTTKYEA
ncbi:MAG: alginate lyase family protein [candidate division WWE3 bacterium]|nr:alginate lyase family protein [candidate division WWE3 bacterium]